MAGENGSCRIREESGMANEKKDSVSGIRLSYYEEGSKVCVKYWKKNGVKDELRGKRRP